MDRVYIIHAEQLNVSAQAISKWENETGMPDISQVVPLASVFKVSIVFCLEWRENEFAHHTTTLIPGIAISCWRSPIWQSATPTRR